MAEIDLEAIEDRAFDYQAFSHNADGARAARLSADDVPALLAEVRKLREQVAHPPLLYQADADGKLTLVDEELMSAREEAIQLRKERGGQLAVKAGRADLDAFERLLGSLTAELRLLREQRREVLRYTRMGPWVKSEVLIGLLSPALPAQGQTEDPA